MKIFALFVIGCIAIIAFNVWLDWGCGLSGAITWSGKVCIEK